MYTSNGTESSAASVSKSRNTAGRTPSVPAETKIEKRSPGKKRPMKIILLPYLRK